jgi:hypothetical protein
MERRSGRKDPRVAVECRCPAIGPEEPYSPDEAGRRRAKGEGV